ncbi:MAG: hypothetical protein ISS01_01705 [Nanoarchaeota archaeon]|nr:hypothetical protein [Nanoarchaeota archaeon]
MNNEESLAALCFNRGCSNLGVLSPVYEVMSNFLSNEAKVLTFDQEKSRLRKDDFVYVRDHHEKLLREKLKWIDEAVSFLLPEIKEEIFADRDYIFTPREAHLAMQLGIRQRRKSIKEEVIFRFNERYYFVEDNLEKDDGYSFIRKNLFQIYGDVIESLEGNNGVVTDLWDVSRRIDKQLYSGLVVYLRADTLLKDFEDRLERVDYRIKF